MLLANSTLIEWMAELFQVSAVEMGRILWVCLVGTLVFASVHLVTMLVTRWGDGHPTTKSLLFSVIVHLACALGIVTFPPGPSSATTTEQTAEPRVTIRTIPVEQLPQDDSITAREKPVWEQVLETPTQEPDRLDPARAAEMAVAAAERQPLETAESRVELPDVSAAGSLPVERPEVAAVEVEHAARTPAAMSFQLDEPTAQARDEQPVPLPSRERSDPARSTQTQPVPVEDRTETRTGEPVEIALAPLGAPLLDVSATPSPRPRLDDSDVASLGTLASSAPATDVFAGDEAGEPSLSAGSPPPQFSASRLDVASDRRAGVGELADAALPERIGASTGPSNVSGMLAAAPARVGGTLGDGPLPQVEGLPEGPLSVGRASDVPSTYEFRQEGQRQAAVRAFGGSDASEQAVEGGLRWLALHQNPDGSWDGDGFDRHCPDGDACTGHSGRVRFDENGVDRQFAGLRSDSGLTALALLAFLGAGYTHEEGLYADNVDRALRWLIRQQRSDGFLGGDATRYARMYCHAMATYALAEACALQQDERTIDRLRDPLKRGVRYILEQQNPTDGGWRYEKGMPGDMSMFGWQLMALNGAEIAGVAMPQSTRQRMIKFLKDRSLGKQDGLAAYRAPEPSQSQMPATPAMTAEALFCKQLLGMRRENPASIEAVNYLMDHLPRLSAYNEYYWYYGTLAMMQHGGPEWEEWNAALRDLLISEQETSGHAAGSWKPRPPWGPYGGRIYSTAVNTLCLEVYYRLQRKDPGAEDR